MLKIPQVRLQQYVIHELPDVQAVFRRARRTKDQIANIHWIIKKAEFQKNIYFCLTDYTKVFDCMDHNKPWKILKESGNTRSPDLPPKKSILSFFYILWAKYRLFLSLGVLIYKMGAIMLSS